MGGSQLKTAVCAFHLLSRGRIGEADITDEGGIKDMMINERITGVATTFKPKFIAYPRHPWKPEGPWRVIETRTGFEAILRHDDMSMCDAICLRLKLEFGNEKRLS